ncbi:MAG TPA: hydroxysqualene dehydroxylase HpnE [Candidatus Baltobacteraceae bacterium]|jgi:squalene-associated FAD-dependent desaturase|nr:hydroxysqualene dehydroxylase HpnE [Candidatus Baltobacteraceae bacterium]
MAAPRVAVIGGGLAGLAAATELHDAGYAVELFERSRLLGGRATSFEVDGRIVDNGQHVFLACCTQFIAFVQRVGMGSALYLQKRFEVVAYSRAGVRSVLRAANLPAPLHIVVSFLRYRHLSLRSKLQVVRALLVLRKRNVSLPRESFASWLHQARQGGEAIAAFWEPFLVPALNAPLDRMDAADAAFVLSTAFLSDRSAARFGYSRVPLATIMEAAAARLEAVHRSCAVLGFHSGDARVSLATAAGEQEFDAAVLAVSPRALEKLAGPDNALGLPPIGAYEPFAIMDVHLWYEGSELDVDFAALLDSPVQWIFQKAPGYLCCSISSAGEFVTKPNAEMVAAAWDEVQARVTQLRGANLVRGAVTRNPEGTYLPGPDAVRPGPWTVHDNVVVAGAWTATGWPDTMESAVRSGIAAARALIKEHS